jgi:nitroimidazol reductase NimA-like FMN-containing flavoprotein (pyridoxamine 5'-phosphate oxidase superfamily)
LRTRGRIPWSNVDRRLRAEREIWIATVSPKGRPDAVPVWFWWNGDAAYFTCAAGTTKPRNILDPHSGTPTTIFVADDHVY